MATENTSTNMPEFCPVGRNPLLYKNKEHLPWLKDVQKDIELFRVEKQLPLNDAFFYRYMECGIIVVPTQVVVDDSVPESVYGIEYVEVGQPDPRVWKKGNNDTRFKLLTWGEPHHQFPLVTDILYQMGTRLNCIYFTVKGEEEKFGELFPEIVFQLRFNLDETDFDEGFPIFQDCALCGHFGRCWSSLEIDSTDWVGDDDNYIRDNFLMPDQEAGCFECNTSLCHPSLNQWYMEDKWDFNSH